MRKYFNKIKINIRPDFRDQLRSQIINEYHKNHAMKTKNNFSWYKKIALLLPVPALVLLGVLFFKKPADQNQPSSWLIQAQEVYNQDLAKQANSVLHQKYIMPLPQTTQRIVETWKSKDGFINENRENGELVIKTIDLYDENGDPTKYLTYFNEPLPEGAELPAEDDVCGHEFMPGSDTIYCHEQGVDHSDHSLDSLKVADVETAINYTNPQSRTEALKAVLESSDVMDKGVVDGARLIIVKNDEQTIEYYFNENDFSLKKWVIKNLNGQDFVVNYLVDEYLDTTLDQIPAFNERDNMTELPVCRYSQEEKDFETMVRQKILNMPTGCYRLKDNEPVATDEATYNGWGADVQVCCEGEDCTDEVEKCSEINVPVDSMPNSEVPPTVTL